jgi:long-chain acyl-CoA synthetase
VAIKQKMMDWWGPVIYETYGGTEGAATIATPRRWLQKPGTVGKAIHGVDIKILDEDGNELPIGEIGEVYFRSSRGGPRTEYFKDPEKTRSIWRGDYLTLGDVGFLDEDGFLFLRDRKKDMIISGGVNIFPAEAEAALLSHPAVGDVAVIGIPDEEWGEQVKAVVEPAAGVVPSPDLEQELIEFCRSRLAHYKCPKSVDFRQGLPRAENGKLYKRKLRDEYWQAASRRI